jgi:hypothetical protein
LSLSFEIYEMKKLPLIIIIILIVSSQCLSQRLELELIVRPALTSLRGNDFIKNNFDSKVNISAGVNLNYVSKNNSILNFAIFYDKKGAGGESYVVLKNEQNQIIGEGVVENESNFDYITIPIQWGKRFGQKVKFQFGVGLYTSFLIKQEQTSKGLDGLVNSTENNTDNFKQLDFGLSASFYSYVPINKKLSLKAGLDDIFGLANASDVPIVNNGTLKHNSLGLSVGLNIKLN